VHLLLGSCISTTESLMAHATECYCQEDENETNSSRNSEVLLELAQHINVLKMHKAKASSLLESTQSIDFLVSSTCCFNRASLSLTPSRPPKFSSFARLTWHTISTSRWRIFPGQCRTRISAWSTLRTRLGGTLRH
jgi:hypothetical protein